MGRWIGGFGALGVLLFAQETTAETVGLQQATATFSQTFGAPGDYSVITAIDGARDNNGWAIYPHSEGSSTETAAFETQNDIGFAVGTLLTFDLFQEHLLSLGHLIGKFRLSATTENRAGFADGNDGKVTPGDVGPDTIWAQLSPVTAVSSQGSTLAIGSQNTVLASGFFPGTDTYTITAETHLTGITGFRLEMLEDPSLPNGGPGRGWKGNFVLSEFVVRADPIPEPSTLILLTIGAVVLLAYAWRKAPLPLSKPTWHALPYEPAVRDALVERVFIQRQPFDVDPP